MIPELDRASLRVAIFSRSTRQRDCLAQILQNNGLDVVPDDLMQQRLPAGVDRDIADVLLVDLDDGDAAQEELLDQLFDRTDLPILLNDSAATQLPGSLSGQAWGRRLAGKLAGLVKDDQAGSKPAPPPSKEETSSTPTEITELRSPDQRDAAASIDNDVPSGGVLTDAACEIPDLDTPIDDLPLFAEANAHINAVNAAPEQSASAVSDEAGPEQIGELSFEGLEIDEIELESEALNADAPGADEAIPGGDTSTMEFNSLPLVDDVFEIDESAFGGSASTFARIGGDDAAETVWVLGASIGGPQALKAFLAELPADIPVGFVLAQHIGAGFVSLLAEQLGRATALNVCCAEAGMRVRNGDVLIAPVEERLAFGVDGRIELQPVAQRSVYSPSVDAVMYDVASHYGSNAHAIVFSGMGNDGLNGCRVIAEKGGAIWAQEASTCVISSMADAVRFAGLADRSGTPQDLAQALLTYLKRSVA